VLLVLPVVLLLPRLQVPPLLLPRLLVVLPLWDALLVPLPVLLPVPLLLQDAHKLIFN
jgi:hypothetical protein